MDNGDGIFSSGYGTLRKRKSGYGTLRKRKDTIPILDAHKETLMHFYKPDILAEILNMNMGEILAIKPKENDLPGLSNVFIGIINDIVFDINKFKKDDLGKKVKFEGNQRSFLKALGELETNGKLPTIGDFIRDIPVTSDEKGLNAFFALGELRRAYDEEKKKGVDSDKQICTEIYEKFSNYFAFIYLDKWKNLDIGIRRIREKIKILEIMVDPNSIAKGVDISKLNGIIKWNFSEGNNIFEIKNAGQATYHNVVKFVKEIILPLKLEHFASLAGEKNMFEEINKRYKEKKEELESTRRKIAARAKIKKTEVKAQSKDEFLTAAVKLAESLNELVGVLTTIQENLGVDDKALTPFVIDGAELHYPVYPLIPGRNSSFKDLGQFFRDRQRIEEEAIIEAGKEVDISRIVKLIDEQKQQYKIAVDNVEAPAKLHVVAVNEFNQESKDFENEVAGWKLKDLGFDDKTDDLDNEEIRINGLINGERQELENFKTKLAQLRQKREELVKEKIDFEANFEKANGYLQIESDGRLGDINGIIKQIPAKDNDKIDIIRDGENFRVGNGVVREGRVSYNNISEFFEEKNKIDVDFKEISDIIIKMEEKIRQREKELNKQEKDVKLSINNEKGKRKMEYKLQLGLQQQYNNAVVKRDAYLALSEQHKNSINDFNASIIEVLSTNQIEFKFNGDKLEYEFKDEALLNNVVLQTELLEQAGEAYKGFIEANEDKLLELAQESKDVVESANESNAAMNSFIRSAEFGYENVKARADNNGADINDLGAGLQTYPTHFDEVHDGDLEDKKFNEIEGVIAAAKDAVIQNGQFIVYGKDDYNKIGKVFEERQIRLGDERDERDERVREIEEYNRELVDNRNAGSDEQINAVLENVKGIDGFKDANSVEEFSMLRLNEQTKLKITNEDPILGREKPIDFGINEGINLEELPPEEKEPHLENFTRTDSTSIFEDGKVAVEDVNAVEEYIKAKLKEKLIADMLAGDDFPGDEALNEMIQAIIAEGLDDEDGDFKKAWDNLPGGVIAMKVANPLNGKVSTPMVINTFKSEAELNTFTEDKDLEYVSTYVVRDEDNKIIGTVSYVENLLTGKVKIEKVLVKEGKVANSLEDLTNPDIVSYAVDSVKRENVPEHLLTGAGNPYRSGVNNAIHEFTFSDNGNINQGDDAALKIAKYNFKKVADEINFDDDHTAYELKNIAAIDESFLRSRDKDAAKDAAKALKIRDVVKMSAEKIRGAETNLMGLYGHIEDPESLTIKDDIKNSLVYEDGEHKNISTSVEGTTVRMGATFAEKEAKKKLNKRGPIGRALGGDLVNDDPVC